MAISVRSKQYIIPRYSLTGDLLAYLNCKLQYRLNSKGSLPPSTPVQLWFGEFIHGVMEEGYLNWENKHLCFPCTFEDIQPISINVANRLASKGLKPYMGLYAEKDTSNKKCKNCLANRRAFESISTWGPELYPLVDHNEVKLEGMRPMPNYIPGVSRSNYYTITGIVDVISSIKINELKSNNKIMHYLMANEDVKRLMENNSEFEIIIDYKGMTRPEVNSEDNTWKHHEWQINTYIWLRELQLKSEGKDYPIVAGVLLYLNELYPSNKDLVKLLDSIESKKTDIFASEEDYSLISQGMCGTREFMEKRSIRVIPHNSNNIKTSLMEFDNVVSGIESSISSEISESDNIMKHWGGNIYKEERCTACDAKCFCTDVKEDAFTPKVP